MMQPLMARKLAAILFASIATASFADQPSREQVTNPLYILGAHLFPNAATPFAGILRYDVTTKSYSPFASLVWGVGNGTPVDGAVRLAATADRIVLQGADDFELDVASGRLLRRYESSDSSSDLVAFHGTIVTEEQARVLGIPSGTYGFQSCTYFILQSPTFASCPNWDAAKSIFLFRRSLDPADPSLTQVKAFPGSYGASIALDPPHRQFWLWEDTLLPPWTTLPITNGVIGDPTPASLAATPSFVYSLTYHDATHSLFELFYNAGRINPVLQQQSTVDLAAVTTVTQPLAASTTAVLDSLPERYVQVVPAIGEAPGTNGTFWHSDLWLYNPASDAVDVTLRRVARPQVTSTQHLAAHGSLAIRDVLKTLGGGPSGDGVTTDALVIDAPYRWGAQLSAYSRTYTGASNGGTYGQAVPAVPSAAGYSNHVRDFRQPSDMEGFPSTIVLDKSDDARFRHNLGVVNDTDKPFDIRLFDGFHKFSIPIAAHSVGTVNLEALFIAPFAVLFAADRPAPVWLSMVDNISGDATFVPFTNLSTIGEAEGELAIPPSARRTAQAERRGGRTCTAPLPPSFTVKRSTIRWRTSTHRPDVPRTCTSRATARTSTATWPTSSLRVIPAAESLAPCGCAATVGCRASRAPTPRVPTAARWVTCCRSIPRTAGRCSISAASRWARASASMLVSTTARAPRPPIACFSTTQTAHSWPSETSISPRMRHCSRRSRRS
jgi:hypothetical protein